MMLKVFCKAPSEECIHQNTSACDVTNHACVVSRTLVHLNIRHVLTQITKMHAQQRLLQHLRVKWKTCVITCQLLLSSV